MSDTVIVEHAESFFTKSIKNMNKLYLLGELSSDAPAVNGYSRSSSYHNSGVTKIIFSKAYDFLELMVIVYAQSSSYRTYDQRMHEGMV